MDAQRFDGLSRAVSRATSRRQALAALAGGTLGLVMPGLSRAAAAPVRQAAIVCNDANVATLESCWDFALYKIQCGIICPAGNRLLGASGCTSLDYTPVRTLGPISYREDILGNGWCASRQVSVDWRILLNRSAVLQLRLPPSCCQSECDAELARAVRDVEAHEAVHRTANEQIIALANDLWRGRRLSACAADQLAAARALATKTNTEIRATDDWIVAMKQREPEPPLGPPPDCNRCQRADGCSRCVSGRCQPCAGTCCPTARGFGGCCPPSTPHCCERSCCPEPYAVCCGNNSDTCCPRGTRCFWNPSDGRYWCARTSRAAAGTQPALVPGYVSTARRR